jgi:hypothetical protein
MSVWDAGIWDRLCCALFQTLRLVCLLERTDTVPGHGRRRIERAFVLVWEAVIVQGSIRFSTHDIVKRVGVVLAGNGRIIITGPAIIPGAIPAMGQGLTAGGAADFGLCGLSRRSCRDGRICRKQAEVHESGHCDGRCYGGFHYFHVVPDFMIALPYLILCLNYSSIGSDERQPPWCRCLVRGRPNLYATR